MGNDSGDSIELLVQTVAVRGFYKGKYALSGA